MKDNEFYSSDSEFHESKTEYHKGVDEYTHGLDTSATTRKEMVAKTHAQRRKLIQFLCSAAMIVVVATAVVTDITKTEALPGIIMNAKTGEGISNVSLAFHQGNTVSGMTVAKAITDENGNFSVALPDGEYTAYATRNGYLSEGIHFNVDNSVTSFLSGTMLPIVGGSEYSIVLTWGEHPYDLDAHLESDLSAVIDTDTEDNYYYYSDYLHVYYSERNFYYPYDTLICNLDVDDTDCYGPETITLDSLGDQPYYYYVYNFSGGGDLYSSEACVRLYKGAKLVKTFYVPTKETDEGYWNVFAIKKGQIIIRDTLTYDPELEYAK